MSIKDKLFALIRKENLSFQYEHFNHLNREGEQEEKFILRVKSIGYNVEATNEELLCESAYKYLSLKYDSSAFKIGDRVFIRSASSKEKAEYGIITKLPLSDYNDTYLYNVKFEDKKGFIRIGSFPKEELCYPQDRLVSDLTKQELAEWYIELGIFYRSYNYYYVNNYKATREIEETMCLYYDVIREIEEEYARKD